ncbi:hypothetical protein PVAND_003542 [Polypedilum vanderplanki]|uniref:glutathione transferase n=1 Tax=Polypedilum vanderplanki TaxID=319348 RepID=A0A9J6BUV2_POLVA|nr:hypothetical protein PVAND_003542 [Polypedilum vanderplanki]
MESKLILYLTRGSPACRSVLQLCRILDLNVELKNVNFQAKEQKSETFSKLNPLKEVPVLVDGDFILSESRAILAYLVNSKKPNSPLYPFDPKRRAIIDQRLYYDATVLFLSHSSIVRSVIYDGAKDVTDQQRINILSVLENLNYFLSQSKYFASNEDITIADISILSSVITIYECGHDLEAFPYLSKWFHSLENLPGFQENQEHTRDFAKFFKKKMGRAMFEKKQKL